MSIPVENYFRYHPPVTEKRKSAHNQINEAALNFAKAVDSLVEDEKTKEYAIFAIQQARMFANQGVVVDELELINASVTKKFEAFDNAETLGSKGT
ncbi:MAG: hypothetical protein WBB28_09505 [Crinalium sp.]